MKFFFGILTITFLFNAMLGCRSTKKLQIAVAKKDTPIVVHTIAKSTDSMKLAQTVLANLSKHYISFNTFSAKLHVQYEGSGGKLPDLNAIIHMYKDSVIWISIDATFLNIEAARILITKNQITILNKQDKSYEVHPFSYIEKVAGIPLDFKLLQDLLIGNPIYVGAKVVAFKQTGEHISLSTVGQYFKNFLTLSVTNDNLLEKSKLDDIELGQNRTGDLTYLDYELNNGVYFPTFREIIVTEKTRVDIHLTFKQYDFNKDLSFPFNIPKSYNKK